MGVLHTGAGSILRRTRFTQIPPLVLRAILPGSKNMSYDSASLTTPDIKWLGVRPSDLDRHVVSTRIPPLRAGECPPSPLLLIGERFFLLLYNGQGVDRRRNTDSCAVRTESENDHVEKFPDFFMRHCLHDLSIRRDVTSLLGDMCQR